MAQKDIALPKTLAKLMATLPFVTRIYLKDSNAMVHSVDSDIFYTVVHLQLHAR